MLVMKLVARSPNVTTKMGGKVKRLLGRGDQRVYLTWLEQQGKDQKITQQRLHEMQQEFNRASLDERRRLANQAGMKDRLDTVPWRDPPSTGNLTTTRSTAVTTKTPASGPMSNKPCKGTLLTNWLNGNKGPRAPTTMKQTWLSWDDLFRYRKLMGRRYRQYPLHSEQSTQVRLRDLEKTQALGDRYPRITTKLMDVASRYQQQQWTSREIYTESALGSLLITCQLGTGYPHFERSQQYGLSSWEKLLIYCVLRDQHWF